MKRMPGRLHRCAARLPQLLSLFIQGSGEHSDARCVASYFAPVVYEYVGNLRGYTRGEIAFTEGEDDDVQ